MFENISGKIKGLAKFVKNFSLIGGIIIAIAGMINAGGYGDYYGVQMLRTGLVVAIAGTISAWPLYGFGELIEKVSCIADHMKKQDNDETM